MSRHTPESMAERRRRLRERSRALRARLREKRKALPRRTRWRPSRLWLVPLLLLLLLLIRPCRCTPPEEPGVAIDLLPDSDTDVGVEVSPPAPLRPLPRLPRQARPALEPPPPGPPTWLEAFRLQVTARSPRLAACVEGVESPGRLKWTTTVEPDHGNVSGHDLQPMLESVQLTYDERRCMLEVLSTPPYRLPPDPDAPEGPRRVGLVIEF